MAPSKPVLVMAGFLVFPDIRNLALYERAPKFLVLAISKMTLWDIPPPSPECHQKASCLQADGGGGADFPLLNL